MIYKLQKRPLTMQFDYHFMPIANASPPVTTRSHALAPAMSVSCLVFCLPGARAAPSGCTAIWTEAHSTSFPQRGTQPASLLGLPAVQPRARPLQVAIPRLKAKDNDLHEQAMRMSEFIFIERLDNIKWANPYLCLSRTSIKLSTC